MCLVYRFYWYTHQLSSMYYYSLVCIPKMCIRVYRVDHEGPELYRLNLNCKIYPITL